MKSVTYVATTNEINIEEYVDMSPRNWILKGRRKPLVVSENSEKLIYRHNSSQEGDKPWKSPKNFTLNTCIPKQWIKRSSMPTRNNRKMWLIKWITEREKIREDRGMKKNVKNRIIEVVMEEVKAGILTVTKEHQIQVITAKNHFLLKQAT